MIPAAGAGRGDSYSMGVPAAGPSWRPEVVHPRASMHHRRAYGRGESGLSVLIQHLARAPSRHGSCWQGLPGSAGSAPRTFPRHSFIDQENSMAVADVFKTHQGERGQVRRPALHRHQGQGAARHGSGEGVRREQVQGRACVRRLLDRRVEGHPGLGHAADAGCGLRADGSVLRRAHARDHVRRASSPPTARATSATRARSPGAPRPTSSRAAWATRRTSARSPSSSSSTPSSGRSTCRAAS